MDEEYHFAVRKNLNLALNRRALRPDKFIFGPAVAGAIRGAQDEQALRGRGRQWSSATSEGVASKTTRMAAMTHARHMFVPEP